ncbi:MAG: peptide chain release factor N(5)-glutamine methyltransferase [Clostridia bacterium]|nr:peptide chain release factor N(5)-glutamine methyltransferase [Clostridia bacterium]
MKLFELRKQLKTEASQLDIDQVDVDFIVSNVLNVKRTELALVDTITDAQKKQILSAFEKRKQNIPVDNIFQKANFFGYEFKVDDNVLTPRPETEILVETAIKYIKENGYKNVLDLCTGSGCIAISIKKNVDVDITASDISLKALQIAKQNAQSNKAEINFIKSNMFEKIDGKFDIIVSNPPYIETCEIKDLDTEVREHDPILALDGGEMGLKFYNIIHNNLRKHLNDNGMLIMEIGEEQKDMLISLFNDFNYVQCIKDYSGNDRIIVFKK